MAKTELLPLSDRAREMRERLVAFVAKEPAKRSYDAMVRKAHEWEHCACGVVVPIKLRFFPMKRAAPADSHLFNLGCQFAGEVSTRKWPAALRTFDEIHARASELSQNP